MATEEVNKPPSLPPYPQMILNAIEALNDKNGSNKSTISKYIESTYGDVPAGHNKLLSHHLNKMKDNGELVFWKNNYTKPDPNAPPRRGRGRPPKPKDSLSPDTTLTSAKGRGRPPKDLEAPPKPPKVKVSSGNGKPRGRPRKMAKPTGGLSGSSTVEETMPGRPRGRPPKVKDTLSAGDSVGQ
ncbi:HMG-Y-related protein A-like [Pyrus x bretschneideri]|uniref:HMG-Y-related protein A-like n=1 Tax=Pyrus x bretschneideri TaxID=225117 RepID=UPI00202FA4E9|nr:HMG-Y-related protein A-like [Pyrus x bretschneideri]